MSYSDTLVFKLLDILLSQTFQVSLIFDFAIFSRGTFLERFVKVSRGERNGKGKLSKSRAKERERKALLIQARER